MATDIVAIVTGAAAEADEPRTGQETVVQSEQVPADVVTTEPQALPAFTVDPGPRWRETTALLQVIPTKNGFKVRGTGGDAPLRAGGRHYGRPRLALGVLADGRHPLGLGVLDVDAAMIEWSRDHYELGQWINGLRARWGDDELQLVIWDDTGFEIPWEMLYLDADPDGGPAEGWLGALVCVSRWTTIRRDGRRPFSDEPKECSGEVAVYLDQDMRGDFAALSPYADEPYDDVHDFLDLLRGQGAGSACLAMVYMACHGTLGDDFSRWRLGGLRWRDLQRPPLAALRRAPSLVFLNACHSGRLVEEAHLGDGVLRGFAAIFLREGAEAVIGTVAEIDTEVASHVAGVIVEELAAGGGKPIAAALRDMRARAVPADPHDAEQLVAFVYRCMYVYYGNPRTSLRLEARQG
ncbi:CHAT domain-containing protein [Nonomuraea gerenzanensis]|nr:CHAT domain-containing protein [Nonomuraea gerenzanensis]UBU17995.1 CHAT domain-containing protein [Nonomuraea gerenzanensis]